jgi:hypothetical protein
MRPENLEFIDELPIRKFFGVGKVTTDAGKKKVRLLGISISNFDDQESGSANVCKYRQLPLPLKFPNAKDTRNDFRLW